MGVTAQAFSSLDEFPVANIQHGCGPVHELVEHRCHGGGLQLGGGEGVELFEVGEQGKHALLLLVSDAQHGNKVLQL